MIEGEEGGSGQKQSQCDRESEYCRFDRLPRANRCIASQRQDLQEIIDRDRPPVARSAPSIQLSRQDECKWRQRDNERARNEESCQGDETSEQMIAGAHGCLLGRHAGLPRWRSTESDFGATPCDSPVLVRSEPASVISG